jgi:zinc transporter ZupT
MNFMVGLILIGVAIAMVVLARPADGESAPFLKVWIVGQIYALTAMVSAVIGVTIVIISRPF